MKEAMIDQIGYCLIFTVIITSLSGIAFSQENTSTMLDSKDIICGDYICSDNEGCYNCPADCGDCVDNCTTKWQCSDWSSCTGGKRTRICSVINNCEHNDRKITEQVDCLEEHDLGTGKATTYENQDNKVDNNSIKKEMSEKDKSLLSIGIVLMAILMIIISFIIISRIVLNKKLGAEKAGLYDSYSRYDKDMLYRLEDYINTNLDKGHHIRDIKKKLIDSGHNPEVIEDIIKKINQ